MLGPSGGWAARVPSLGGPVAVLFGDLMRLRFETVQAGPVEARKLTKVGGTAIRVMGCGWWVD